MTPPAPHSHRPQAHDHDHHHHHHHHHHRHDEDHIREEFDGPIEEHPLWQRDHVTLTSVGIDIGSAGTQVILSRVHLRRQGVDLSSRFQIVERETCFESPVRLTPYQGETRIDARALGAIVDEAYMLAGVRPEDIDTGIVILTGEALRRENAERIARILSEKCGELVCASAGHHMEAMLAAYGSGAAQASYERNERILNVDIGGGTTKLSIIENGKVVETGALHIGARLIAIDKSGHIARLEPAGRLHAARAGFAWQLGVSVTAEQLATVAASMTNDLIQALTVSSPSPEVMALYLSKPILSFEGIGSVIFSGGVAEFIYGRETRDFGDLGRHFGVALRHNMDAGALPWRLLTESQGIRSTALGASEHTVQLSGSTTYISDPATLLPKRNLQVLRPEFTFDDDFDPRAFADAVQKHLSDFGISPTANFALALHWRGQPDFRRIEALAIGIRQALSDRIALKLPCYLVLDADIAMTLGALLRDDLSVESELLVIDGIALWDFDYIDIGKLRMPSGTVSVTIKSLIFHEIQLRPQRYALANVD